MVVPNTMIRSAMKSSSILSSELAGITSAAASQRSAANLNGLFQAAGATPGTYNIYVELVGMPAIMNEMSPYVQYTY